ncbi:MAG: TolC family protein, partial [Gemmatimonadetes bacterium]|nr:TolC family protein [Gemmatimonadota bacterium]
MIPILLLFALAAQDTTRLTLGTTIERALGSYPTVAAARAVRDRAAAEVGEARAGRLPRIALDGSLNRFQEPMVVLPLHGFDLRNPPLFDRTLIQSGVSLNWTIFDFGNRAARVRAQRALGSAAEAALSTAEIQLVARTVNAYLRVSTARDVLLAQDQRLTALAAASNRMGQLLAEGKAARVEGLRVDAEAKRAQADRIASASQLEVAEHELAQLSQTPYATVHASALTELRLVDTAAADTSGALRAAIISRARGSSTELRELEERSRAAGAGLAAAKATWFPELRVSGAYIDRGRWAGDFAGEWQAGVSVSYPLFTGGSRVSGIRRASAEQRAAN